MNIMDLTKCIRIGNIPITIYHHKVYTGIYCFIRITRNNTVFLDFDDTSNTEGGFRAKFVYETIDSMIKSIENYTNSKIDDWSLENHEINLLKNEESDWIKFKNDLYYKKIPFLTDFKRMYIGDLYWRGIYRQELSPEATSNEIKKWIEMNL